MAELLLSNRPELAIMALAIERAQQAIGRQQGGGYLGRTALQKILYFLVRRGVPLPYRFEIYNYGPFCSDIYHDVECLQADHVVEDVAKNSGKYWNYSKGSQFNDLMEKYSSEIASNEAVIEEVVGVLANMSPEMLELTATLDYLFQDEKARWGRLPDKEAVVNRFMEVKKDRFQRHQVANMFDSLMQAKIFF